MSRLNPIASRHHIAHRTDQTKSVKTTSLNQSDHGSMIKIVADEYRCSDHAKLLGWRNRCTIHILYKYTVSPKMCGIF